MAKLRHIAMTVPDPEKAAAFYQDVFEFKRVENNRNVIMLSDGVVNLALIRKPDEPHAKVDHFGVEVDDLDNTDARIHKHGGKVDIKNKNIVTVNAEAKYLDPNGVHFDISHTGWKVSP